MKLSDILNGVKGKVINGNTDIEIKALTIDSRKAGEGVLFVARSV